MAKVTFVDYMRKAWLDTVMPNATKAEKENNRFVHYFFGWINNPQASFLKNFGEYLTRARFILLILNVARRPVELLLNGLKELSYCARDTLNAQENNVAPIFAQFFNATGQMSMMAGWLVSSMMSPVDFATTIHRFSKQQRLTDGPSLMLKMFTRFLIPSAVMITASIFVPPLAITLILSFLLDHVQIAFESRADLRATSYKRISKAATQAPEEPAEALGHGHTVGSSYERMPELSGTGSDNKAQPIIKEEFFDPFLQSASPDLQLTQAAASPAEIPSVYDPQPFS